MVLLLLSLLLLCYNNNNNNNNNDNDTDIDNDNNNIGDECKKSNLQALFFAHPQPQRAWNKLGQVLTSTLNQHH